MALPAPPAPQSDRAWDPASSDLTYRYRPRMVGGDFAFRLEPDALAWELGRRNGRLAYRDIARLRLGYRPANLAGSRFIAEIWSRAGAKFEIASISQRSLFDYQNLAAEYRAFIIELAYRIAVSGGKCRCDAGFPPWRWWPALFVAVATLTAAIYVSVRALIAGAVTAGAVIAALGLFFLWQIGSMVVRNRPRTYDPNSPPGDVLP
jgi:hypothetical protein